MRRQFIPTGADIDAAETLSTSRISAGEGTWPGAISWMISCGRAGACFRPASPEARQRRAPEESAALQHDRNICASGCNISRRALAQKGRS